MLWDVCFVLLSGCFDPCRQEGRCLEPVWVRLQAVAPERGAGDGMRDEGRGERVMLERSSLLGPCQEQPLLEFQTLPCKMQ